MPRYGIKEQHFYTLSELSSSSTSTPAQEHSPGKEIEVKSLFTNIDTTVNYEDGDSVSKQKRDFSRYLLDKKRLQASLKDKNDSGDNLAWLEQVTRRDHEEDHFMRTVKKKAPNAELTANLLDEVMELRNELENRIKELGKFKEEIRQVGKLVRRDPLLQDSADTFESASSCHQVAARADHFVVDPQSQCSGQSSSLYVFT